MTLSKRKRQEGQAFLEYLLLLFIVMSVYLVVARGLVSTKLAEKLTAPVRDSYANAYKYGHPQAKGYDEGGPQHHPRVRGGTDNFRIFINPR